MLAGAFGTAKVDVELMLLQVLLLLIDCDGRLKWPLSVAKFAGPPEIPSVGSDAIPSVLSV